ncbi:MAG: tetratricopeptide repeat protein, partial [Anaerolineales bacterium]
MPGREDVFQKAMNEGHSAAWDQEWERAAAAYRRALEEFPDHPKALSNLGLALYQQQKFDEALQVYMRVARQTPDDPIPVEKVAQISERLGNLKQAIDAALVAADLYLKLRDPEKAIENWLRVTSLNPEHLTAHSRLAMVHEKMGQAKQAVTEFIAVASLLQRTGNAQKAAELIEHALQLDPSSAEARQAQGLLKTGQLLPKPVRAKGATAPLRVAQVKAAEPKKPAGSDEDPVTTARKKALAMLADILFELTDESPEAQQRRGLQAIMKGTGMLSQQSDQTKIMLHLSIAIDAQTKNNEAQAAEELEHALETGLKHPALYFDLGYLRSKTDRLESAHRFLQQCVKHEDYGLAARLLSGDILARLGRYKEAAIDYLEALKTADAMVVAPEQSDTIRQLYEPLIEAQSRETDEGKQRQLCKNVHDLLMKPGWRESMLRARMQLPKSEGGPLPLAEILIQAQSSQVLEAMNTINQLARAGRLRSAMDEA